MKSLRIEISYTTREYHSLNLYFNDLARIGLLSDEEEVMLCRRVREGDLSAMDRLVSANLRFVVSCAKKYDRMGVPLSDLINEGNLGLITAARKFDETLGFKFITYAVFWIRQAIMSALGEHSRMIRLPMNQVRNITVAQHQMGVLEQQLERSATMEELAHVVGITVGQMEEQLQLDRIPLSLYQTFGQQAGEKELIETVADQQLQPADYLVSGADNYLLVDSLLATLTPRERGIIESLYGINCPMESSYDVVAARFLLTSSRIKQIAAGAINKLKTLVRERGLVNA
ncbi:hypothetical protein OC25_02335 [Pedobacter kyungheensis]|uniref:RNA polymerase sigma factor rpoD n=1 Tax=Pedobacter kyungheensis TaxID=1069985 RepID=A0A0C1FY59_9SPHI|nr:RNA polymerase sigma factor RpoD/SigA [Pedobacter kyungheensis]KIA96763.1 hypothetical protein OC25_02335 [Pedobacter kyungheensis]